jgi:hypothetical protein
MTNWKRGVPNHYGYDRYDDSPIYQVPENLEFIGEFHFNDEPYEFDMVALWKDTLTNEVLGAYDSGCSCPTPFAGLTKEGMLVIDSEGCIYELANNSYNNNPHTVNEIMRAWRKVR